MPAACTLDANFPRFRLRQRDLAQLQWLANFDDLNCTHACPQSVVTPTPRDSAAPPIPQSRGRELTAHKYSLPGLHAVKPKPPGTGVRPVPTRAYPDQGDRYTVAGQTHAPAWPHHPAMPCIGRAPNHQPTPRAWQNPRMQIYLVGGAVRDKLLDRPVVDRDHVVVGATPEELLALGYKPVGKDFPVFLHPRHARGIRAGAHRAQERARLSRLRVPGRRRR